MLKVIDLDLQSKEEGFIFVLSIAGEKMGVTDQEVVDLIKQKYTSSKSVKRISTKKTSTTEQATSEAQNSSPLEVESRMETGADSGQETSSVH